MSCYLGLVEEGYDLALRVGSLDDSNLVARRIGQFPLSVAASPSYLEAHGEPGHPKELVRHECLVNTLTQSPHRWAFREGRRNYTVKVAGRCDANDDEMLLSLACSGFGIAYLPRIVTQDRIASGELVPLLSAYLPEPFPVSIVYPSARFLSTAKRALIDRLSSIAETFVV
jgi:LysR family transcriptional regulator for bpeEF and oprC